MTFLAPLWLALGAAAAIPIVLHLLRRRRGVRVEFPAVRFLLRAEREHQRELRLRNLLLMVLRAAIIVAIALAAARPLGRTGGAGHAPTATAIVIDNSLSSAAVRGGGPAIEALRHSALQVLDAAGPGDRAWLLTVDGGVAAGDAASVRDAASRAEPIGGAGDLPGAVEHAATLVHGSGLAAGTIVVVTDGQASAWSRAARVGNVPVVVVSLRSAPPRNRSVREVHADPARWMPRGDLRVAMRSADSSDVRVVLGDRTLARTTLGPDGVTTVRAVADRRGWTAGRVELQPDELRLDDVRYFAVFAGDAPAVHVDASAGSFARGAIETLASAGRIELGGAIAVAGAEDASRRPVLAFAPSDPVRAGAANRALAAAGIPWRLGGYAHDESSVHGGDLDGVAVHARYALNPAGATATDTLATAGGSAWVVAGDGYVLVASPLDVAATTLPVSAKLLPWIESVIARHLLTDGGPVIDAAPLTRVTVPLGVDEIVGPDQRAVPVRTRSLAAPSRDGVYWLRRAGATVGALVVNPEPAESDLTTLDPAALAQRIAEGRAQVLAPNDAIARAAFAAGARRPLGGALMFAALAILVIESFIAREPRRAAA